MMEVKRISLTAINAEDKRYQVRDPRACTFGEQTRQEANSRQHIKDIVKALNANPKLRIELIEVVQDPNNFDKFIIVDGFHRYAAYSKICEQTKGKRCKQIRVHVHINGVPKDRALKINTEHKALKLTGGHLDELKWQKFLDIMEKEPQISIKETADTLSLATSTVSNWRKLKKQNEESGFFNRHSKVFKNSITGFPMLKACRDELKSDSVYDALNESEGALVEADKELLVLFLKKVKQAKEPNTLYEYVTALWGQHYKTVDLDQTLEEIVESDKF